MRLCFVVQRYGSEFVGGAEHYARRMATGLSLEGHDVAVLTSCAIDYSNWADVYEPGLTVDDGVTVHRYPVRAPRNNDRFIPLHLRAIDQTEPPLWPWAQARWAQTMGPDLRVSPRQLRQHVSGVDATIVVGYHYAHSLRLLAQIAPWSPTVLVPTAHPEGAFHVGIVRQLFEHADQVVCLTREEADLVGRSHRCWDRITVVPAVVDDIDVPSPLDIAAACTTFDLDRGSYAAVVGRIDPAKGSDDAIRFTERYRNLVDPDFRLLAIGPGQANEASTGVTQAGFVDAGLRNALVAGADMLLQPSYMESFSLSLMEGWLLERPAVVQRRSAVLAGHAMRSGGGVMYADYEEFEAAVTLLRTRPRLRRELGHRGRRYVCTEFSWGSVAPAFIAAVERAVRGGRHRRSSSTCA